MTELERVTARIAELEDQAGHISEVERRISELDDQAGHISELEDSLTILQGRMPRGAGTRRHRLREGHHHATLVETDGSHPLIADWDAGGYTIQTRYLQADTKLILVEQVSGENMTLSCQIGTLLILSAIGGARMDIGVRNIGAEAVTATALDMADSEKVLLGTSDDAEIYFDGGDLIILTDGAGANGIILDSEDDTLEIKYSGAAGADFGLNGLNLVTGDYYSINSTSVLNATTLGANVVASSLTSVGALDAGSITSNFGTINTGASAITTTGALGAGETTLADGASLNLQEAITYTGATTENLIEIPDNLADALSVKEGANAYLTFISTNGSEAVKLGVALKTDSNSIYGGGVASVTNFYGGVAAIGGGGKILLSGSNSPLPLTFSTPNAAKNADVGRLGIAGNVDAGSGEILLYEDLDFQQAGEIRTAGATDLTLTPGSGVTVVSGDLKVAGGNIKDPGGTARIILSASQPFGTLVNSWRATELFQVTGDTSPDWPESLAGGEMAYDTNLAPINAGGAFIFQAYGRGGTGGWKDVTIRGSGVEFQAFGTVRLEVKSGSPQVNMLGNAQVSGAMEIDGYLNHDGSNIGFFGVAPAARAAAYTVTNGAVDRAYDADATTVEELADVLGTLIADLTTYGLLQ